MLYDLVDRIEVYHAQKIDGITVQHIDINYHCIGSIEVSDILPIPETDVQINMRQGITLKYGTQ
jgi:site-specific DNA recombinase